MSTLSDNEKHAHQFQIKNWTIVERQNPASDYPSDFDVIHLYEKTPLTGLDLLTRHPLIKSVTPQRIVHRTLKFLSTDDDDDDAGEEQPSSEPESESDNKAADDDDDDIINFISKHLKLDARTANAKSKQGDCCVAEFQNFRRGLSSSTSIDTSQPQQPQQQQQPNNPNAHSNRRLLRAIPRQITHILKADALWSEFNCALRKIL
jgi:hypothetical protein